jgi:hypothetical protein
MAANRLKRSVSGRRLTTTHGQAETVMCCGNETSHWDATALRAEQRRNHRGTPGCEHPVPDLRQIVISMIWVKHR